jgi:phage terminase Nu1 subunit (DNA packaging protein)
VKTHAVDARTLAEFAGISTRYFYHLQKQPGAPPPISKGRYDLILFSRWYHRRSDAELARRGGPATDTGPEMNAAKLALTAGQARRVELHNLVKRGDMVPTEAVTNLWAMRIVNVRQKMRGIPSSLGPQLTNKTDPAYIEGRIMDEINNALAELEGSPRPQPPRDGRRRGIV